MNNQPRVMLLIDADNVSADVVDQAVAKVMTDHGAIHVRRAYCTAESALANLKLFKSHSIRPIVNLSTGKNSTDIALAVDAVDLVICERPDVVVVVSSDSDFAPLVIKLREKGCRVEGIGQLGKTGDDSKAVYDAFTDIAHRKAGGNVGGIGSGSVAAPRKRARAGASRPAEPVRASLPAAAPAPEAAPVPAPAKRSRTRRSATSAAAASTPLPQAEASPPAEAVNDTPAPPPPSPSPPSPAPARMPDALRSILAVLPELARGGTLDLGIAAERLRSENLLARKATSTKLFRQHPEWFELSPERQPNKVRYRG